MLRNETGATLRRSREWSELCSISLFYQFWLHTTSIRHLPRWFEAVFNAPSHHRVHHGSNVRYLFPAPGWSHDGQDKRASVLRRGPS